MYEPIAVVGTGLRFPGDLGDLRDTSSLIDFLCRGGDAVGFVPANRWNTDAFYDPDESAVNAMYVRRGAFLRWDFRCFDAAAFGISPREAALMDPQQRLVLEVATDCLDDANADFDGVIGSRTGVFIGGFMLDHFGNTMHPMNRPHIGPHTATSSTMTMLSNRLSFVLGLRGPSMTVDTACSSSLVAIHLACRALQTDDADLCLAGGVNFMFRCETMMMLCKGHFLARDGRSKSFDVSADGYGRGEGCGIVALKRLRDAEVDGDNIVAIIRGSGVNQDGATPGITVPSKDSQLALMEQVYRSAGLTPRDLDVIEAHGTGTPVGDPIEVGALRDLLDRAGGGDPVGLGSLKAGIGHQEAAAGVAGLLKAICSVKERVVFPQAWLQEVNPALQLDESPLRLAIDEPVALNQHEPSLGAVNSFGYGGTNAHLLVSAA